MSSLPASIQIIGSKPTEKRWRYCFPHYKSMGAFCCHGNQSFDPICPKTLCSLSPTPVMLHIKFYQVWPTGLRDIQVWKCGRRTMTMDGWRKKDGPLVYYKFTLWAFGSGELIIVKNKHVTGLEIHLECVIIMHQSFETPAPMGPRIAGLKCRDLTSDCRDLTSDKSRQCRRCAGF